MFVDERMADLGKLMDVASFKARVHAANIAHQNTPGYRTKAVRFDQAFQAAIERGDRQKALSVQPEVFEPRTAMVQNDGNDVSVDTEVTAAAKNALLYRTYLSMLRGKMGIFRTAISPTGG